MFGITYQAMQSESEPVALQGVEFWSNVCDEEMELMDLMKEAEARGEPPRSASKCYAQGAQRHLIPVLLALMEKVVNLLDYF